MFFKKTKIYVYSFSFLLLVVENIQVHVSISATVAYLVSLNAGVDVSIDKVNLTILGKMKKSNE
jgi:sarcosine oxidase gamma subunit